MILTLQITDEQLAELKKALTISEEHWRLLAQQASGSEMHYARKIMWARKGLNLSNDIKSATDQP
jgi:hypothetical protein